MRRLRMTTSKMLTYMLTLVMRSVMESNFFCRMLRPDSVSFIFCSMLP